MSQGRWAVTCEAVWQGGALRPRPTAGGGRYVQEEAQDSGLPSVHGRLGSGSGRATEPAAVRTGCPPSRDRCLYQRRGLGPRTPVPAPSGPPSRDLPCIVRRLREVTGLPVGVRITTPAGRHRCPSPPAAGVRGTGLPPDRLPRQHVSPGEEARESAHCRPRRQHCPGGSRRTLTGGVDTASAAAKPNGIDDLPSGGRKRAVLVFQFPVAGLLPE